MTPEQERRYTGLSHAAWGYFFLHFDFNLGPVSILPRFVGWLLLLSAISALRGERRELGLLRPLGILEALWSGGDWLLSWAGSGTGGHILFLDLLLEVVTLYFHFQFLTDMAALAEEVRPEEDALVCRLLRRRTVYLLTLTAIALTGEMSKLFSWVGWEWLLPGEALVGCVVAVMIMAGLFELRRYSREVPGGDPTE